MRSLTSVLPVEGLSLCVFWLLRTQGQELADSHEQDSFYNGFRCNL